MNHTNLPTPTSILASLNEVVIGQHEAKRAVAFAAWRHCHRAYRLAAGESPEEVGPKQNVMLLGPTGCGKTTLAEALCNALDVPFCRVDMTAITSAGYVGDNVNTILGRLFHAARGDLGRAERGIVLLDNVDKIAAKDMVQKDVNGEAVQQALLDMLEGARIPLPEGGPPLDSAHILFIALGAFAGLEAVVRQRVGTAGVGRIVEGEPLRMRDLLSHLESAGADTRSPSTSDFLQNLTTDDMVKFGMIPEFLSRFAPPAILCELTEYDYYQVLKSSRTSPVSHLVNEYKSCGVELVFTDDALWAVVELFQDRRRGVRGLRSIVERPLEPITFALPDLRAQSTTRVVVDAEAVHGRREPSRESGAPRHAPLDLTGIDLSGGHEPMEEPNGLPRLSITKGWSKERVRAKLEETKARIDYANTSGSAKKWWETFEAENAHRLGLVLRLAEELAIRKATITEFFLAYIYSSTDNIQANLHYMDYVRLKKAEERQRKERARLAQQKREKEERARRESERVDNPFDDTGEEDH